MGQKTGLAETKNWSSWNEIIETSDRLQPLRPQNKQLHYTKNYRLQAY
jgi:hypothetical protein